MAERPPPKCSNMKLKLTPRKALAELAWTAKSSFPCPPTKTTALSGSRRLAGVIGSDRITNPRGGVDALRSRIRAQTEEELHLNLYVLHNVNLIKLNLIIINRFREF